MSLKNSIIYFLLGNKYHKEIGNYLNESIYNDFSEDEINEIILNSKNIFEKSDEKNTKNKKCKECFRNYNIYYTLTYTNTFYLSALKKDFESNGEEDEIFELFVDIEIQGIKKLTDKNGELSRIGQSNLKFCIEQNNRPKIEEKNLILNFFKKNEDNEENVHTISLLSTQINNIQTDIKDDMKNLLNNEDENDNNDDIKNEGVKEKKNDINIEEKFELLQKRIKCRRIFIFVCCFVLIATIVLSIVLTR